MTSAHGRRHGEGITYLVLNTARINALFDGDGMVVRWGRVLGREVEEEATRLAPHRDSPFPSRVGQHGKLNDSIRSSATPIVGRQVAINVRAEAGHAIYVHEGTAVPGVESIFPIRKRHLLFFDSRAASATAGALFIIPTVEYLSKGFQDYADLHGTGRVIGYRFKSGTKPRAKGEFIPRKMGVAGQHANPFLANASRLVLRARGIVH